MEAINHITHQPIKPKMKRDCVVHSEEDDLLPGGGAIDGYDKKKTVASGGAAASFTRKVAGGSGGAMKSCQAEKCSADLSDSKPYHRRHKVCEHHAKAPVAVVAGIRQRFCQQCSRFHELSEFDEAKRSCRRRLAGHNERRRKTPTVAENSQAAEGSSSRMKGAQLYEDRGGRIHISVQENANYHQQFHVR